MHSIHATNSLTTGAAAEPALVRRSHQSHHEENQRQIASPSQAGAASEEGEYPPLDMSLSNPPSSDDGTKDSSSSPSMSSTSRTTSSPAPFLSLAEKTFTPLSMDSDSFGDFECDERDAGKHQIAPRYRSDATHTNQATEADLTITLTSWTACGQNEEMVADQSPPLQRATATVGHQGLQPPDNDLFVHVDDSKNSEPVPARTSPSNSERDTEYFSFAKDRNGSSDTLPGKSPSDTLSLADAAEKVGSRGVPTRYRRDKPTPRTAEALVSRARRPLPLSPETATPRQELTQALRGNDSTNDANTIKFPNSSDRRKRNSHIHVHVQTAAPHNFNKNNPSTDDAAPLSSSPSSTTSASSIISHLQQQLLEEQQAQETSGPAPPILRPQPLVRTTSDNSNLAIRHPAPDINLKSGAYLGKVAQLEATAERLSTTSSIEDAIRDLHTELKRSDSQRSSILAARVRPSSNPESEADNEPPALSPPSLSRQLSTTSSIISLNSAARQGGYSPGGYNISPSHSINNRLRSGSKTGTGRFEMEFESYLSRTGPGKGSVRSIHSNRLTLAEIAEMEPTSLTQEALDEADRSNLTDGDDDTIRPQPEPDHTQDMATPNAGSYNPNDDSFHAMLQGTALEQPAPRLPDLHLGDRSNLDGPHDEGRPTTSESYATMSEHSPQNAFQDFDGVHCEPDIFMPPPQSPAMPSPTHHGRMSPPMTRPKTYLDPETGQQMLYYPARVPMMLNLPPKLSKKPKAKVYNERRSKVLSSMPQVAQQSAPWLPDPLEGHVQSPFSPQSSEESATGSAVQSPPKMDSPAPSPGPGLLPDIKTTQPAEDLQAAPVDANDEVQPAVPRPQKANMTDAQARKSRMSRYDNLPPQLRASVYFDLGNSSPELKIKDGSAMATLDNLLDASAHAPVSAFTDHAIAGKLGSEIYGPEKKRKSKGLSKQEPVRPTSSSSSKKRGTFFLRGKKSAEMLDEDRRNTITDASHVPSNSASGEPLPKGAVGYATLSPDTDEFEYVDAEPTDKQGGEDDEDEESGEDEEYYGPPTTLLAELQLRKQQQKNRTRPAHKQFPNGMHTTLLELDAVAETQRMSRKGKKVNLAWEEPGQGGPGNESSDEDVPLGVLFAAKASGAKDLEIAVADLNRPLGLMERRDMEDNEPLSHRRARLQNSDPRNTVITKRHTLMLNAGVTMSGARHSHMASLSNVASEAAEGEDEDEEVEGETLGERMRRLKPKEEEELPKARPVSVAFSAELLGQFEDPEEQKRKKEEEERARSAKPAVEEEETLGQRRRRLQAEKEARDQELGMGGGVPAAIPRPGALHGRPALGSRLSMADILSAHPKRESSREDLGRQAKEEELRYHREQDQKMAAMRMQMPTTLQTPSFNNNAGAFHDGAFNDGAGGSGIRRVPSPGPNNLDLLANPFANPRASAAFSSTGLIQQAGTPSMRTPYGAQNYNGGVSGAAGMGVGTVGPLAVNPYGGQMQMGMGMPMTGMQMGSAMQMGMGQQMGMHQQTPGMQMHMGGSMAAPPMGMGVGVGMGVPQGQPTDMIDRWRQSIVP